MLQTGDIKPNIFMVISIMTRAYYYYYCYYQFYYYCAEINSPNVEIQFYLVGLTEYPSSHVFNPRTKTKSISETACFQNVPL